MSKEMLEKIRDSLVEVNKQQEIIRMQKGVVTPQFIAHATHVSQEDYRASVPSVYEGAPENVEIVPAFEKATQNELSVCKDVMSAFYGDLSVLSDEELSFIRQNLPKAQARVFGISTKQDESGNTLFDEKGVPVLQDASYAYSVKKSSACISFVNGIPLLIGFQEKYNDFESGKNNGHIYIGKGDTFKPEYDEQGNITEWISAENMKVDYHIQTTPRDAMQHNVQFVMFNTEGDYKKWADKVDKKEKGFKTFVAENDYVITSLQEEILNGRATFINATSRGCNPKLTSLTKAVAERNKIFSQQFGRS